MEYTGEGIQALICAVDDLSKSNLIFADKKLTQVLKCLAYYDEFKIVLRHCSQGFNYEIEKQKAMTKLGETDILKLPKNEKHMVSLVLGLLVDMDSGLLDLISFSDTYFPRSTKQEAFKEFCTNVVEPFKFAIVQMVIEGFDDDPQNVKRNIELAQEGLHQQTQYLIVNISNEVKGSSLDEEDRLEIRIMIEGLAAAMDSRDSLMIKSIWIGLRRVLKMYKLCEKEIQNMDESLRMYLIIK